MTESGQINALADFQVFLIVSVCSFALDVIWGMPLQKDTLISHKSLEGSLRNRASAILLKLIVCSSTVSTLIFINKGQHECFTQSRGTQTCAALDLLALPCFTLPSARYYALFLPGQ